MSKESGEEPGPVQGSIPVCTLFSDGSAQGDNAPLSKGDLNLLQSVVDTKNVQREKEPALCNVFATESSTSAGGDDIFSKISSDTSEIEINSEASENTLSTDVSTSAMETLRLNKSVDSFIVEDLAETDVIVDDASQEKDHDKESKPEKPLKNYPDPSAGGASETYSTEDTSTDESHQPVIASPSFISVTSFSVSPDEQSSMSASSSLTETSALTSELGGLTIEDVKKEDFKHDLPPSEGSAEVQGSAEAVNVQLQEQEKFSSSVGSASETKTTESLFSQSQDTQQSSFFSSSQSANLTEEDDPFAAALSNSALDRRRDAWIPSIETKKILMTCIAEQKAPDLVMEKTTRPGLSSSEMLEDPVKDLVTRLTGSENVVKRENLTMDDVSQDRVGILKLMASGNHRSAANLCAKLLSSHGQGFGQATQMTMNTPETLWLWYTRIYVLIKLKLFEMAATELAAFRNLDNPDLYFEFYPNIYPGRRGSMVPFEFRLMYAEFPRHVEKPEESLTRLHKILTICEEILKNLNAGKNEVGEPDNLSQSEIEASLKFWTEREVGVLFCVGNTLVQLKDYVLAVEIYDQILEIRPERAVELQSGIGRLYLHIGDIRSAQQRFASAEKAAGSDSQYKVQLLINRGFMYIGTNNWKEAFTQFDSALNLEPDNITALNNKAVCLLYLGRLKDAISILEEGSARKAGGDGSTTVQNVNKSQATMQGLLLNLSTLYELESSRFVMKKRALFLKHIAPTCGDSFDTACFKEI